MPLFLHPNLLFHHIPMMVYWIGICWLWRPFEMLLHKWAVWLPSVWILAPMGLMIIDAFSLMNEHITAISIRPDRKSHHCKATIPLKYSFQPDFVYSLNFEWTWSSVEVIQMILSPATSSQWMIIKVLFFWWSLMWLLFFCESVSALCLARWSERDFLCYRKKSVIIHHCSADWGF